MTTTEEISKYRGQDRLGTTIEGYPVVHPYGKVFLLHYKNLTPMWTEVDIRTLERIED